MTGFMNEHITLDLSILFPGIIEEGGGVRETCKLHIPTLSFTLRITEDALKDRAAVTCSHTRPASVCSQRVSRGLASGSFK